MLILLSSQEFTTRSVRSYRTVSENMRNKTAAKAPVTEWRSANPSKIFKAQQNSANLSWGRQTSLELSETDQLWSMVWSHLCPEWAAGSKKFVKEGSQNKILQAKTLKSIIYD